MTDFFYLKHTHSKITTTNPDQKADVVLIAFFVITNRYLVIRQQFLYEQMKALKAFLSIPWKKPEEKVPLLRSKWQQVVAANDAIIQLTRLISRLNRFWSVYVSIFFLGYIILVAYFAYSFLFIQSTWEQKAFFCIFFFDDGFVLFFVIAQTAIVVRNHVKIEEVNERLCRYFIVSKEVQQMR